MNYILDTHVFRCAVGNSENLSAKATEVLRDPRSAVFVSAVNAIEIAIKSALGKLEAPDALEQEVGLRGFSHLPLHYRHGSAIQSLPPHHLDPFDRMLIAQAMQEGLTVVTHDRKFAG